MPKAAPAPPPPHTRGHAPQRSEAARRRGVSRAPPRACRENPEPERRKLGRRACPLASGLAVAALLVTSSEALMLAGDERASTLLYGQEVARASAQSRSMLCPESLYPSLALPVRATPLRYHSPAARYNAARCTALARNAIISGATGADHGPDAHGEGPHQGPTRAGMGVNVSNRLFAPPPRDLL